MIDDCSTSKQTISFISKWIKNNKNSFRWFSSHKNSGCGVCRNIGFNHANGDIIMYLDSDDWLHDNCFQVVNDYFNKYQDLDILSFGYNENNSGVKNIVNYKHYGYKTNVIIIPDKNHNIMKDKQMVWTKAYSYKFLKNTHTRFLKDYWYGEDCYYQVITYTRANKMIFINDRLITYRRGHKSMTTTFSYKDKSFGTLNYYIKAYRVIKNDHDSFSKKYVQFLHFLMNERVFKLLPEKQKHEPWFMELIKKMHEFCKKIS